MTVYHLTVAVDADSEGAARQCYIDGDFDRLVSVEAVDPHQPTAVLRMEPYELEAMVDLLATLGRLAVVLDRGDYNEDDRDAYDHAKLDLADAAYGALARQLSREVSA